MQNLKKLLLDIDDTLYREQNDVFERLVTYPLWDKDYTTFTKDNTDYTYKCTKYITRKNGSMREDPHPLSVDDSISEIGLFLFNIANKLGSTTSCVCAYVYTKNIVLLFATPQGFNLFVTTRYMDRPHAVYRCPF